MSFFGLYRRIFCKEQPVEIIQEMTFTECHSWIVKCREEELQELPQKLQHLQDKLECEIKSTQNNLQHLAQATLRNQNIPERAKQIMEGNRKTYIFKIEQFLNAITLPILIDDFNALSSFSPSLRNHLDVLARTTMRSYQILQEFFAQDISAIAGNLKSFDAITRQFSELIPDVLPHEDLLLNIMELQNQRERQQEQETGKLLLLKQLEKENEILCQQELQLQQLTFSKEYGQYVEIVSKQTKLMEMLRSAEENPRRHFAIIEAALKKYIRKYIQISSLDKLQKGPYKESHPESHPESHQESHLKSHKELLLRYLTQPINALEEDGGLYIVDELKNLKEQIMRGKIELKDKKKQKILHVLEWFTKENLGKVVEQRNIIKREEENLQRQLSMMPFKEKMLCLENALEKSKQDIAGLKSELERIEKLKIREEKTIDVSAVEKVLKDKFGREIKLVKSNNKTTREENTMC